MSARALFPGDSWLELDEGASVTFKHVASAREWTLLGPGRMRPCRDGEEQVVVASGRVRTSSGAGARPGAEVLLFAPHTTVRYGDASLTLAVSKLRSTIEVASGQVWLEPPLETKAAPSATIPLNVPKIVSALPSLRALEQRCETLAQRAAELGEELATGSTNDKAQIARRAVEHLNLRRAARVSCGSGEALAATLDEPERGRLIDRFATLNELSRTLSSVHEPANP